MSRITIFACLFVCLCACVQASVSQQALIILKSDDFKDTETTVSALESIGAHACHVIPPRSIIAIVPTGVEDRVRALPNVAQLYRDAVPTTYAATQENNDDIASGIGAWNHLITPQPLSAPIKQGDPLVNDSFLPPVYPPKKSMSYSYSSAPGYYDTSMFLVGKVAIGVVLPESSAKIGTENWSITRRNQVFNEIVEGMNWWCTTGNPNAKLTFYYDMRFGVQIQVEPITCSTEDMWITPTLQMMGYSEGSSFENAYAYINDIRDTYNTDWCFAFFVADSLNDADGWFPYNRFAYAYIGGPYSVMTYDNDGWGIDSMSTVATHESGHIFYAPDEYYSEGYQTCGFGTAGYLGVPNLNCEYNNPNSVDCMMRNNAHVLCQYTIGHIGWRDSDGDGLPDVIDNVVENSIESQTAPAADGSVTFIGETKDVPCNSPIYRWVTINKITAVKYRVDGGEWMDAVPIDGAFDQDLESYTFTVPDVGSGFHTVEIQSFSSSGNSSNITTRVIDPTPPVMGAVIDEGDFAYDETRLEARWSAVDNESEVTEYAYAIGTAPTDPGSGYVKDWTSTGSYPAVNTSELNLIDGQTYYFYVKAKNSSGNWSDSAASDGITVRLPTIGQAKLLPKGKWVAITGVINTGNAFLDCCYVQSLDRSAGIKVYSYSQYDVGTIVKVRGQLWVYEGEACIYPTVIIVQGQNTIPVLPLGLNNLAIGGGEMGLQEPVMGWRWTTLLNGEREYKWLPAYGLNNIGLLVKTTGEVTYKDALGKFAYIDDGSRCNDNNKLGLDGSAVFGLKVAIPADVELPPVGHQAVVVGVPTASVSNTDNLRVLRIRTQDDVWLPDGALISGKVEDGGIQELYQTIESPHPYHQFYTNRWTIVGPTGTQKIRAHFEQMELVRGSDFVYVEDNYRKQYAMYDDSNTKYDFWSPWVDGNTLVLRMSAYSTIANYGFKVDKYEVALPATPLEGVEISLEPGSLTTTSDASGRFFFSKLAAGTYTITPSYEGIIFNPLQKTVTVKDGELLPGVNFTK